MSTVKAINFQHPDAASPAITLDANGDATIPSLPPAPVDSVNTQTGEVVLDTDDVAEGGANLYYTDARADARISNAFLNDLSDVDAFGGPGGSLADGRALAYTSFTQTWEPADVVTVINYGSDRNTARPSVSGPVLWVSTTEDYPFNFLAGDVVIYDDSGYKLGLIVPFEEYHQINFVTLDSTRSI